ncbi:phage holin family protein [Thiobacillus sedimenti]|uniref:Phage holin family protein n=1 Tax=Thiobacillus sedimenti TaxID=3110231 RepID=A0ABZ1CLT7_9PROT|nr:phage holin family protein [Thiobacillus sp. SCUT-2]WRS40352.1 phage holin family protein [Thiobacillus sp. SCUT-2]
MGEPAPGGGMGLFESLKTFAGSLVAIAHTRLDLLANDLEEERDWLLSVLGLLLLAAFCLGLGLLLLVLLLVVAFWESHRLLVLAGLAALFLGSGAAAVGWARHKLRTKPRLFAASLGELSKDRERLMGRS